MCYLRDCGLKEFPMRVVVLSVALLTATLSAQKLEAGMAAPPLAIAKWVKGQPVAKFETGKVYVVEFWATWCGPCIQGMPHLSALQKQYADRGLTVIGVTSADPNNTLEAVETMAEQKGDVMGYTVAWDTDRTTNEAYMQAARQNGIPCAFLVDQQGEIAYIGHPYFLDFPLAKVIAGTWDIKRGEKQLKDVSKRLEKIGRSKPPEAFKELLALGKSYPELDHQVADQLADLARGLIAETAKPDRRDVALAMTAAEKAVALTDNKDAKALSALAAVCFHKGDHGKAVEWQQRAVAIADTATAKRTLEDYQRAAQGDGDKRD